MNKKIIIILIIALISIFSMISYLFVNDSFADNKNTIDSLVPLIEKYKNKNGYLPSKLDSIGYEETIEGPIYYSIIDSNYYELYFGLELGESHIYESKTGNWR